jgi:peptidyl-prolyl cis-trans isomerase SurA
MLKDLSGVGSEIVHQISSRHILVKPSEVRDNEQVKKLINDLYARIENGEDFALLAKEYSEDPGSALQGGDLGWSVASQFVKNFSKTLEGLKKGEISKPFQTEFGWHILQKLDERDHDMTLANQKNQAYQAIYERKFADELEAWLITIREEAFIEIKN